MMKYKLLHVLLVIALSAITAFSQVPQGVNFQGIARDASGLALAQGTQIGLRLSVLQGSSTGSTVYSEEFPSITLERGGIFNVVLGKGTPISGTFSGINWQGANKWLRIEMRQGAGAYSPLSTSEIMSVPYAQYAGNGIANSSINAQGQLIITTASGATLNVGNAVGPAGPQGPAGPTGATGPQGPIGLTGAKGDTGAVGPQGPIGLTGAKGDTGSVGPQGPIGLTGAKGDTGAVGPQGPIGLTGAKGDTGSVGPQGPIGLTGAKGDTGAVGPQGPIGLTGPKGDKGDIGDTGPQGPIGLTGVKGDTGSVGPQGPIGPTGATGSQGVAGANGISVVSSQVQNDSLYLTLSNNQVINAGHVRGLQGVPGATGLQGPAGPQGSIGLTGATGSQGPAGPQGLLSNGTTAGNTPYWNGTAWVLNNSNLHNNGAGVGVGTNTPNTSAKLEVASTTQGFLPPRMTTVQRDAIASPAPGLTIYNTSVNCLQWWNGTIWFDGCGNNSIVGSITAINCGSATNNGTLTSGTAASGVTTDISYTGGNGGTYTAQIINSTGITGLTASVTAGTLATGNGSLTFNITGTPANSGTASFALSIGGQSCTFTRTVAVPQPAYPAGTVHCIGTPTAVVEVTNPVTGRIWMDRNLGASRAATSGTDTAAYGDLYQWGRRADGHQCRTSSTIATLSSTDQPAHGNFITINSGNVDWRSPQNNALWQGVNGVNNPCPTGFRLPTKAELNAELASWSQQNSAGAIASPLKLPVAGLRNNSDGLLFDVGSYGYYWSSTVEGFSLSGGLYFLGSNASMNGPARAIGFSVRCIKDAAAGGVGSINTIDCTNPTISGTLTSGTTASGVTTTISYTGGNGGTYTAQTITSTGVTGLTASLTAGTLAMGNGTLSFTISGTPASSGTASFALSIGGQSCTFTRTVAAPQPAYPTGTVHCNGTPTAVVEVTNPVTGRIWMDRNLGASQAATSSTDTAAYGDLYQWGRRADGHQCRNSGTTTTLSSTDQPAHGNFIMINSGNYDWRNPQNDALWQGVNGINNPCPNGFRLPTQSELDAERSSWSQNNSIGSFASPLRLTVAGLRSRGNGSVNSVGSGGYYWSSTVNGIYFSYLYFDGNSTNVSGGTRAYGSSVRCLKDAATGGVGSINSIDCANPTHTGTLASGTAASGVTTAINYTGGNGGTYSAQTISSTGVTGLTATLTAGTLATGNGTLTFTITGTPASSGTASFALSIGGQSCTFTRTVAAPQPAYPTGTVHCNGTPTAVVEVTNPVTGRIWMDRNLGASQAATSSTDTAAYGDLYQWGRRADGHQCRNSGTILTVSTSNQPVHNSFIISSSDWRSPQNNNLWQGVSGINNPCPSGFRLPTETEYSSELSSWNNQLNSVGAFNSPLKLPVPGVRDWQNGEFNSVGFNALYWTSSITGTNAIYLNIANMNTRMLFNSRALGTSVRCVKDASAGGLGAVNALDCNSATHSGILTSGTSASGISTGINYSGGDGGTYPAQTISSTGVTGLTASLTAGTLANGNGTLTFNITGIPSISGTASFALIIGGQSCTFTCTVLAPQPAYPIGTVHCNGTPTTVIEVTNPTTGRIWMDRNLGASRAATSSTDTAAYGDLYQWGRKADGHQCRNSGTTPSLSSTDQPSHGNFIIINSGNYDWRNPQNDALWQGVNGINNPCPNGFRLPTQSEVDAERLSWSFPNSIGAFASSLKLPMAGYRYSGAGSLTGVGSYGVYWSSTTLGANSGGVDFIINYSNSDSSNRADGNSIRCIKN